MKYTLAIVVALLLLGCKKDTLVGDLSILEGKWKWISYSKTVYHTLSGGSTASVGNANEYSDEYIIEFDSKGKVKFIKNNDCEEKYRTVVSYSEPTTCQFSNCYIVGFLLNNKEDNQFTVKYNTDTLVCNSKNVPLQSYSTSEQEVLYDHYYVKVK